MKKHYNSPRWHRLFSTKCLTGRKYAKPGYICKTLTISNLVVTDRIQTPKNITFNVLLAHF